MKKILPFLVLQAFLLFIFSPGAIAQKHADHDSSYYDIFWHKVTGRIYAAQKFTHFTIPSSDGSKDLQYVANPKLNVGIGVTWHNLSLNAFYGFAYLNNKDTVKGKTKGLDLQLHLFPRKWVVDLLVVMPKGFHANPKGYASPNPNKYYYREDVKERIFGLAAYRLPNKKQFSYRAALNGNEWQKKSAGSVLYGGQAYYVIMESNAVDSLLVPKLVQSSFPKLAGITESRFITIGPGAGYAYTFVMNKHLFLMLSGVGHLDVNIVTEEKGAASQVKKTSVAPSLMYKSAVGYNSANWGVNLTFTGNTFWAKGPSAQKYSVQGGALRFSVTKKFDSKKNKDK